jgi:aminoglycoside phosphotransferase (APT) family kinase protein
MASPPLDQPRPVREGEALDLAALERYLREHLPGAAGPLLVEQFPGGFSNLTYLIRQGEREMVLRRPPFGANIATAHDMNREYTVLSHLEKSFGKVPRPLLYCEDAAVIGAPFYLMERVKGVILRALPPKGIDLSPDLMRALSFSAADTLADLHAIDPAQAGLDSLGKPEGYVERQISGWSKRYRNAQTDDIPELERVIEWLAANQPPESGAVIIHNDFKYDNLVLDPADLTRINAVLDWEMCTLGDPLMDLGTTLAYWVEASDPPEMAAMFGLTALPGNLNREELVARYSDTSGRTVSQPLFYYLYGLFKVSVIAQQIYARYQKGLTQDQRFGMLIHVIKSCGQVAGTALDQGRISGLA